MTRLTLRSILALAFVMLTPLGCGDKEPSGDDSVPTDDSSPTDDTGEPASDVDGDGFTAEAGDCDDNDAAVNPGAASNAPARCPPPSNSGSRTRRK